MVFKRVLYDNQKNLPWYTKRYNFLMLDIWSCKTWNVLYICIVYLYILNQISVKASFWTRHPNVTMVKEHILKKEWLPNVTAILQINFMTNKLKSVESFAASLSTYQRWSPSSKICLAGGTSQKGLPLSKTRPMLKAGWLLLYNPSAPLICSIRAVFWDFHIINWLSLLNEATYFSDPFTYLL